ncbi:MAG: hypothetical protein ACLGH0_00350 [Thermoanaerobaculia bacterium]
MKDRDGDGLTDFYEERIVTDPANADTDGDGMSDARDPLPLVAYVAGDGGALARALAEEQMEWTGSTLLLTKTEHGWESEILTMWIT